MSQQFLKLIQRGATAEVADALAADPALLTWRDNQGVSALLWSIYTGQSIIRDFFLAEMLGSGQTLDIFEAAAVGDPVRLEPILTAQPQAIHDHSGDGWTPLHLAAAFGTPAAVQLLLTHGADIHAISQNPQHNQPLHAAMALSRNLQTIQFLLDAGANPNATQSGGYTPIFSAAAANRRDLVELLIAHGANPAHPNDFNQTPATFARERNHTELADWLDGLAA